MSKRLGYVLGTKSAPRREDPETYGEEQVSSPSLTEDLRSELNSLTSRSTVSNDVDEDEDDALSFFQKLAEN